MINENQGVGSGSGTPAPEPSPLTHDEVFSELDAAFNDPSHRMHHAAKRGLPAFDKWSESLYRRIPNMQGTVDLAKQSDTPGVGAGIEVTTDAGEAATQATLRASVSETIAQRGIDLTLVKSEAERMVAGADGAALADVLNDRTLEGLTPEATREAHVGWAHWMSDLAALRAAAPPPSDDEEGTPANFQETYVAALQERGINVNALDDAIANIFLGRQKEYKTLIKHLDSFPASVRLQAYVRSAEAVLHFAKLRQYVN